MSTTTTNGSSMPGSRRGVRWRSGKAPKVEPIRPADAGRARFPYHLRFHATTWIEHEVRTYLAQRRTDRPMFLVISFPHPHPPLNPPEPYASRYDEADTEVPRESIAVNDRLPEPFRAALRGGTAQYGGCAGRRAG